MSFVEVHHATYARFDDINTWGTFLGDADKPSVVFVKMSESEALRIGSGSLYPVGFNPYDMVVPVKLDKIVCRY